MSEWKFIEKAIDTVKGMLLKKKDIWTSGQGPFHQFDAMHEMHITPEHFGVIMTNLKMNRLKTVFDKWMTKPSEERSGLFTDPDFEDSLIDLASYAQLTLGIIYRAREGSPPPVEAIDIQQEAMKKVMEDAQRNYEQQQAQIQKNYPQQLQVWYGDPPGPTLGGFQNTAGIGL